jgi:hypothetical protein
LYPSKIIAVLVAVGVSVRKLLTESTVLPDEFTAVACTV